MPVHATLKLGRQLGVRLRIRRHHLVPRGLFRGARGHQRGVARAHLVANVKRGGGVKAKGRLDLGENLGAERFAVRLGGAGARGAETDRGAVQRDKERGTEKKGTGTGNLGDQTGWL